MPTRRKAEKKKAGLKPSTKPRKSSSPHRSTPKRSTRLKKPTTVKNDYVTYVYECTRPGCGYKIWRDDKSEPGQLRNDLKCPKCHHLEFRCLGKGDIPESFQAPIPTNPVDLDPIRTSEIGSN